MKMTIELRGRVIDVNEIDYTSSCYNTAFSVDHLLVLKSGETMPISENEMKCIHKIQGYEN